MNVMYPLHKHKVTQSATVILSNIMVYVWPFFHMLEELLLFTARWKYYAFIYYLLLNYELQNTN